METNQKKFYGVFDMEKKIEIIYDRLMCSPKRKFVCLSTTANINNPPFYIASFRETEYTISANFIFRDLSYLPTVISKFDGQVERFLVDCEIKNEVTNLVETARSIIKKSIITIFKPNDLTVEALDVWISVLLNDPVGLKAVIFGPGNIGSKIAVKLAERGMQTYLYGRDYEKSKTLAKSLDTIIRGTGKIEASDNLNEICQNAYLVLGCTPGIPVIGDSEIDILPKDAIVIDVGNGTVSAQGVIKAKDNGIRLFCLSAESGYLGYISCLDFAEKQIGKMKIKSMSDGRRIITPGIIGAYGDILVDDVEKPSKIIGVCNGSGDILPNSSIDIKIEELL